jgi:hypothetical protein
MERNFPDWYVSHLLEFLLSIQSQQARRDQFFAQCFTLRMKIIPPCFNSQAAGSVRPQAA